MGRRRAWWVLWCEALRVACCATAGWRKGGEAQPETSLTPEPEAKPADQLCPARTRSTLVCSTLMRNAVSLAHTPGIAVTDLDVKCKTSTGSNVSDSAFSVASDKPTAEPVVFTKVCHHTFMDVISSDMGSKLVSSNSAVMTGMRTKGGRGIKYMARFLFIEHTARLGSFCFQEHAFFLCVKHSFFVCVSVVGNEPPAPLPLPVLLYPR